MTDNDKQVLENVLSNIPQVQAVNMIRKAISPQDLAQQIMQAKGLAFLTAEEQAAIMNLMVMSKAGREVMAGRIIGMAIEQKAPGLIRRFVNFLFGWL
jgi:hypothetical protein